MNKRKHFKNQHVLPLTELQQKMHIYKQNIQVQGHKKQTRRYNLHLGILPGRETAGCGTLRSFFIYVCVYLVGISFTSGQRIVYRGSGN